MASQAQSGTTQDVAAKVAGHLGLPQPNQLLATHLISLARSLPTEQAFVKGAKGFGRFEDAFLVAIRDEIKARPDNVQTNGKAETSGTKVVGTAHQDDGQTPMGPGLNVMSGTDVSRSATCSVFSHLTDHRSCNP